MKTATVSTTKVGITGGIGSGKSYVARLLAEHYGIPVYDSDREAKRLMQESQELRRQLTELLGADTFGPDGSLQRHVVARFLFASAENAAKVNALVHPAVKDDFRRWAARQQGLVALESAILLEAGFRDSVDMLLVVTAPEQLRLQRTMQRDGATEQQVRQRMARQAAERERLQAADFVVHNDGRPLLPQLDRFLAAIL